MTWMTMNLHRDVVSGIVFWHTLGSSVSSDQQLNIKSYQSIVADHVHLFMAPVNTSSDDCFHQNTTCYKAQITLRWSLLHDNELLCSYGLQSPNPSLPWDWDVKEWKMAATVCDHYKGKRVSNPVLAMCN